MNIRLITRTVGYILWVEGGFLLLPLLVSLGYGDGCWEAFLSAALLCGILGALAYLVPVKRGRMQGRDAYAAVALAWVALTLTGTFPYLLSDTIPSFVDALFETASGLTTTGATILDSVETMPPSILFWRSETQWMGGMGVLVLFLALMPHLGDGAYYLMKAESPGPIKSKLVPRVGGTAKILYTIYIVLTAAEAVALRIAGMSWFDAVNHSFTTMATGGFSVRNTSIAEYQSDAITWVIVAFTFLAGINFSLLYAVVRGRIRDALRSEELRWYLLILAATIGLICVDLHVELGQGWYESVTDAAFQATTIMSTTGYATKDFTLWPTFSRCILVLLMYVGGCAGSTAGGMKISRLMLQVKSLRRELDHIIHPNRVSVITIDGQSVDERAVNSAHMFQVAYLLILMAGTLVVSLDVLGFTESFVASLTCISNVGPSLGALGPMANFAPLSWFSKLVLALIMLMGRLELMPLLVLLSPVFLVLAIAIKLDSHGPVFYRQVRVTQYGREFRIFKFRTMVQNADRIGSQVTVSGDSRITRVGKVIRSCRLDEVGQLLNVLGGSMSFVGTRPEVPKYVARYTPEMMATLLLPAGVTSEASIRYKDEAELLDKAEDVDETYVQQVLPGKMAYNLASIRRFGLGQELLTMLRTVKAVL